MKRLLVGEPVSIQFNEEVVYCFNETGAFVLLGIENLLEDENMWHLVDSNYEVPGVPRTIYANVSKTILATPLTRSRYRDWVKSRSALRLWMEPFSWEEMYITA